MRRSGEALAHQPLARANTRATAMTPIGSPVIAQIGLSEIAEQLFPDLGRIVALTGAVTPAARSRRDRLKPAELAPLGPPRAERFWVPIELRITPGSATALAELIMQPMTRSSPTVRASIPAGSIRDSRDAGGRRRGSGRDRPRAPFIAKTTLGSGPIRAGSAMRPRARSRISARRTPRPGRRRVSGPSVAWIWA